MNFEFLDALLLGLDAAWQAPHLGLLLAGCLIGLVVGALPGLGPASAMALLLPFTVHVSPLGALVLMAAIYYGAQYSGAATAIWTNVPGESSAAMTCNDGHPMALAGRGGQHAAARVGKEARHLHPGALDYARPQAQVALLQRGLPGTARRLPEVLALGFEQLGSRHDAGFGHPHSVRP